MWMLTMKIVTAAEANRQFSAVLREVANGESVLVTSRGKPVATIVPARQATDRARERAKKRLFERLASIQPSGTVREWTRDELYD
jgi:prevent-host-death family protein